MTFDPLNPIAGLYDMPHAEYHALFKHGVMSRSVLMRLADCPAAVFVEQEETPAMLRGRAFHCLVLEGREAYEKQFIAWLGGNRTFKAAKEQWAKMQIEAAEKNQTIIDEKDAYLIETAVEAVNLHPFAKRLTLIPCREQSVIWQDEETGIWCRARPDISAEGQGVGIDVKFLSDVSEHGVSRSIQSYGIDVQAAMTLEGMNKVAGKKFDAFLLIAVCPDPPHHVEVFQLDDEWVQRGHNEFHRLLRVERQCREAHSWPNYQYAGNQVLTMPGYLKERWEER
jgi:hypothetical protein